MNLRVIQLNLQILGSEPELEVKFVSNIEARILT